jgi:hypothetical protein
MLQRSECQVCQGTGVRMIQTSSMLGLLHKTVPTPCGTCAGTGHSTALPACIICRGQGLVGNESEICRSCNGTGHVDSFAMIPLELLHNGTHFRRRCDSCGNDDFEIRSEIKSEKLFKTWDDAEELRQYELVERVTVACTRCPNRYDITIDPAYHKVLDNDTAMELERLGLDLTFLYSGNAPQGAPPAQSPAAPLGL